MPASFTEKQGQYLAFIHAYSLVLGRPPAEADIQRFFSVTPPSVHRMVLTLERKGFISRKARQRSKHPPPHRPGNLASPSTRHNLCAEVLVPLVAFRLPDVNEPETTVFSNFYIVNSVSADLTGLTGGTSDAPIMLPATPISSVSGGIGGDSPDSSFVLWKGGSFAVSVGVRDASTLLSPPSYLFDLCNGTTCGDVIEQTVATPAMVGRAH